MYRAGVLLLLVLIPLAAFAAKVGDADWPRLTILAPIAAPTIDGKVDPAEWAGTVAATGFTRLGQGALVARQPVLRLAYTPQALLIAAEVPLPPGEKARAAATDFDGTVWNDDSVEIHLDRGHTEKKGYQFVVNALGTHFDAYGGDAKWNGPWEAKALNTAGKWSAEFSIPWATVGGAPAAGDLDGFNAIINSSYLGGTLTLAPLKASAHETANYLHLSYGRGLAVSLERLDGADLESLLAAAVGDGEARLEYTLRRTGDREPVSKQTLKLVPGGTTAVPGGTTTVPLGIPADAGGPKAGDYTLSLRADGPTGPLLVRRVELQVEAPLRVRLAAFTRTGLLKVFLIAQPAVFKPEETDYDLTVSSPAGTIKHLTYRQPAATSGTAPDLTLTREELTASRLGLKVVATNRRTGATKTVERELDNPLRPAWLGTKEGITDKVAAPWTPLKLAGDYVKCWGRSYHFGKGPLPAEVVTGGKHILAGPIRLVGNVGGRDLQWTSGNCEPSEVTPEHITMAGIANSGDSRDCPLRMKGTARIEYDGMIRVDLTLTPGKPEVLARELTLEIPLNTANARYLYHFPGQWGSVANSGFVPKAGWAHGFKPFVWLGDEDRGFSWWCESDENWYPYGNPRALTVDPAGAVTYLRCHLVATETTIDKPLKYTFGFQATPVKQPDKTVWDYRITHHGNYGLESERAATGGRVTYPIAGHLRREEGTFECWYRPAVDSERQLPFEQRRYSGNREIFTVQLSPGMGGTNYGLYYNGTMQGLVGWARTDGVVTDNPGTSFDWKADEWHHVAMTWDKQNVRIYLDGKQLSETPNKGFFAGPTENAAIMIGGDGALASIDEVRLLSVARPPTVLDRPCEPDAQTLLLDHFEGYGPGGRGEKPGTPDAWVKFAAGRFGKGPTWAPQLGHTRLEELAGLGVRTICFHEHWVPYQSYPHPVEADRPRLHSLADGVHAAKMNLLLYMSRQFADNSPEWELYSDEACSEPRPAPYTRYPAQRDYIACWNGPYKDFSLYWLGKTMDEFGNDGWYLDGPEWPTQCANRGHGCGYLAADGTVRPTWDIFATREFMKRLYVLTRTRKPQGQLNIHNSTVMVIPTLGWGTSSWGGEQIDAIKPPVKTLDILPLDAFRTEFMGRQWGVPSEFLVYDGMPYYAKDVLAYTLLHGVLIRPGSPDSLDRISALWKVYDQFPFDNFGSRAKMYPYWNNGEYLQCSPQGVYATAYERKGEGLLVIVSNLGDAAVEAGVTVRLAKFGLGTRARVTDALSGETIAHDNGALKLAIDGWRYRVLRVRPR